jgi:transmembrane sensor
MKLTKLFGGCKNNLRHIIKQEGIMNLNEVDLYKAIFDVLSKQSTPEDQKRVQDWLSNGTNNKIVFKALEDSFAGEHDQFRSELVFKRLKKRIKHDISPGVTPSSKPNKEKLWLKIAVVAIIGLAGLLLVNSDFEKSTEVEKIGYIEKTNPNGQKSTIFLNDGTKIKLNSGSKISYKEDFADTIREVFLEGEAYFEVAKNIHQPFVVRAGDVSTKVLGTSFNVKAFSETSEVSVSLVEGKVQVAYTGEEVKYLNPGLQYTYHISDRTSSIQEFNNEEILSWIDGVIYFEKASKNEVFETLAIWYGVEFVFGNADFANWNLSAIFENESLENVLNSLGYSEKFSYKIEGKKVRIQATSVNK